MPSKKTSKGLHGTLIVKRWHALVVAVAFGVLGVYTLSQSYAAPGGGGKPNRGTGTIEMYMVTDKNADGKPNYGDAISFHVSIPGITEPHLDLLCYQNGTLVLSGTTGYYSTYPWPWTNNFTLTSNMYTGGAADCTAKLYYFDGRKSPVAQTISFTVNP